MKKSRKSTKRNSSFKRAPIKKATFVHTQSQHEFSNLFTFPSSSTISVSDNSENELNKSFDNLFSTKSDQKIPIFFFINPKSGSTDGRAILNFASEFTNESSIRCPKITLQSIVEGSLMSISAYLINILDKDEMEDGIQLLKTMTETHKEKLKVLIGGGDGTVLSLIDVLNEKGINIAQLIFGPVPLGTGNDLSNALGFGGSMMFEQDEFFLFDLLFMYEIASESKIDIWNLELKVEDRKGRVCNIEKNKEQEIVEYNEKKEKNIPIKILNKTFINYCSIGYEARVGFSFEKIRSKNRIMNKWIYFWKALKKYTRCCRKNYALKNLVYSFQVGEAATSKPYTKQKNRFFTNNILYEINNSSSNIILNGDPISIVCQNINYYLGGSKDIWKNSGSNIGLTHLDNNSEEEKNFLYEKANSEQRFDDKKLEFFTYESEVALGLENIFSGHANKIYHGNGPVRIVFRKGVKDKVYLNIDGEYLRIYNPEYIKIKLDDRICNGQISFLRRFG